MYYPHTLTLFPCKQVNSEQSLLNHTHCFVPVAMNGICSPVQLNAVEFGILYSSFAPILFRNIWIGFDYTYYILLNIR